MINIVKIYQTHCMPCKMLTPILEKLQAEFTGRIQVTDVNADEGIPELYQNMNIMSTPTVLFLKDGVLLDRFSGIKSYDEVKKLIEKLLKEV